MHELSIARSIVETVCERAGDRPVHTVTVRVGALTAVVPDALRFCFALAVEGTVADGARLAVEHRPGTLRCRRCGTDARIDDPILLCPCGSADVAVIAGRELQIVSMEVG
ncbi:hydrogenase maturation nickel metallochaperone HypA/HybF [Couchioplanes caeruleus]|uniref:Hydrogenase maturation factor HypA n=2 Tax=Couchioplanes caeruleus TaxID=56438 RepID=A0A1K0GPE8_9ACTN|nr:hydrogenase maturation nickel metallochaperone HypA [Couchioplanes caeruleus]OJF11107.1 hydrogenase nickel incorporation protein HypA [Couchioplanes caeruleus subsp. caeruleus]ROP33741.1 hydrogenase-3 nickel incorporation protein HypA [Couchioplanes caeruleus]